MPCQEFVEAGPSDHALTITPRQPLAPNSPYLIGEPAQASTVTANAVIGEVAPHHRGQMAMLVAEGPVAVFSAPSLEHGPRPGKPGFCPYFPTHVPTVPRASPDKGLCQKADVGAGPLWIAR